jgi:hypothetical protein
MRMVVLALTLVAALTLAAGCKSATELPQSDTPAPKASTYDGEGDPKIKFKSDAPPAASAASEPASEGPGVLAYAAVPFKNIVYVPWKFIGGGAKGVSDGVQAGFSKDRMPILGVIFLPVNAVVGFLTGAVETVASAPVFVGPTDSFGHAMAQPTRHTTAIWWYE